MLSGKLFFGSTLLYVLHVHFCSDTVHAVTPKDHQTYLRRYLKSAIFQTLPDNCLQRFRPLISSHDIMTLVWVTRSLGWTENDGEKNELTDGLRLYRLAWMRCNLNFPFAFDHFKCMYILVHLFNARWYCTLHIIVALFCTTFTAVLNDIVGMALLSNMARFFCDQMK